VTVEDITSLRWVTPQVVAEIAFTEFTAGDNLRHASFVTYAMTKRPGRYIDTRRMALALFRSRPVCRSLMLP
jgi:ATP-dependent DNA ligase